MILNWVVRVTFKLPLPPLANASKYVYDWLSSLFMGRNFALVKVETYVKLAKEPQKRWKFRYNKRFTKIIVLDFTFFGRLLSHARLLTVPSRFVLISV